MRALPGITIITPSYNQGEFIEQTVESVLNQGYPDLEYILMDGGSTDGTLDILKRYTGQLHWVSEQDRGQSHAINKGLALATGQVIAFLNSDDTYVPGALWNVGEFFARHPQAQWLAGRCRIVDERGSEIRRAVTVYKNILLQSKSFRLLQVINYLSQPATFWRRTAIEKVGFFDESLQHAMDYEYSLRMGQHFNLWVFDDYLANYRIHAGSKAGSSASAQFTTDLEIARRYIRSRPLIRLHAIHNALIIVAYRILMKKAARTAQTISVRKRS